MSERLDNDIEKARRLLLEMPDDKFAKLFKSMYDNNDADYIVQSLPISELPSLVYEIATDIHLFHSKYDVFQLLSMMDNSFDRSCKYFTIDYRTLKIKEGWEPVCPEYVDLDLMARQLVLHGELYRDLFTHDLEYGLKDILLGPYSDDDRRDLGLDPL